MNDARNVNFWLGIALAVAVSLVAGVSAEFVGHTVLGFERSPVSEIMMAIVIGMLIANLLTLPSSLMPGLKFCASTVLRIGIMLLGIRLSLFGAGKFTLVALPFVVFAIAIGLITIRVLGRSIGLSTRLSGLIAVGTSICGATAIVATAPLIKAKETEVSYSIACITVFGLAAMFAYPFLAYFIFAEKPELAGLFLGTAIHETAQVAGAGLMYEEQFSAPLALETATVTKLVRNLCMIAVIPLVGWLYAENDADRTDTANIKWLSMVPWFIVGFALMSALRTVGDLGERPFGILSPDTWNSAIQYLRTTAERCLLIAMAAVGLTSLFGGMREIGLRPFALGLFAALLIGVLSLASIFAFGDTLLALTGSA